MGKNTPIEWADNTINFYLGCTKVSKGCDYCYIDRILNFTRYDPRIITKMSWTNIEKKLKKWQPSVIFVNSMSDTFHESINQEDLVEMFAMMWSYPKHQFIVLTKRINKAYNYFKGHLCPDNVWIGTSVENKASLHRIDKLRKIDARIRFVSCEPLLEGLGQIDLNGISWIIVGGESDIASPRPFEVSWAREILSQCRDSRIAYFFKQTGGRKKIGGHWGSDKINLNCDKLYHQHYGQTFQEMPIALASKPSTPARTKGLEVWQ